MIAGMDKLIEHGCSTEKNDKVCRSRGGESCAFDGAMIVLQPIANAAHLVHGPIACCGNSWEGRGTRSRGGPHGHTLSRIPLYRMGFTTDMGEMDIVYGSEAKLALAIRETFERVAPNAIFVYATCVSGLIGEDIDAVCRKAEEELGVPVIPVNAPGFVGPKNLGNRIAGEVLIDKVIGTGQPPCVTPHASLSQRDEEGVGTSCGQPVSVNLIGEYNIAGDLWLVEPVLKRAGFSVMSRMTGDATFEEITWAHHAHLNVVVCSRALINVAKGMEQKYGIPYIEVSFFGKTEMAKALRLMGSTVDGVRASSECLMENIEEVIADEERKLEERLKPYAHLKGKRAVLYTGGVKSWSFISALQDLGMEIVAVGTKKSTYEDEEKMRELLGPGAPLVEDVTPKNLKKLLKERNADVLVAGGRNQYLAIKEGYPFVDVNQERHLAYAGYEGLINLAEQISAAIQFYEKCEGGRTGNSQGPRVEVPVTRGCSINPLKHSPSVGAAMAFQGIHSALPVIHGAQGCTFLAKVLLTKHFREPIALAGTKLFAEDVVMGSEEALAKAIRGFIDKDMPDVIGLLTSGLTEIKGDDVSATVKSFDFGGSASRVLHVPTPDYEGGLESGYVDAVESLLSMAAPPSSLQGEASKRQITVLAGCHLTPADFLELRECIESFGLAPVILPDLACLDGSRQGISALASGGTRIDEILSIGVSEFTIAIGASLEPAARNLKERFGTGYRVFESLAGLEDSDRFMETLSMLSGMGMPERYARRRRMLIDGMRDAQVFLGGKKVCIALEADLALQTSRWLTGAGARVSLAVLPAATAAAGKVEAERVVVGDLSLIDGDFDLLISNSHAEDIAARLGVPLFQAGFPAYKVIGATNKVTIGYHGTLSLVQEVASVFLRNLHR